MMKLIMTNRQATFSSPLLVQLYDSVGRLVEVPMDSHPGFYSRSLGTISFDLTLALKTELNKVPPGSMLVLEVKHWKPKSRKFSVLAWSFVEFDTLFDAGTASCIVRQGTMRADMYRKPVVHVRPVELRKLKRLTSRGRELQFTLRGLKPTPGGKA
jgi:hypothetical protein